MADSDSSRPENEIERLRKALDAETQRCVEVQRQLDRADGDFAEFVSRAAHNLREPLRNVTSFSQLLAEAYGDRLDSEAGVFLARILEGAARMQSLLTDVVDYCVADAGGRPSSRTDMEAVLRQALLLTDSRIGDTSAVVTHDPLPVVTGNFDMLARVLHHLIRNAIEYAVASAPCVHISARRMASDWVISVRDNGPGIDPAFRDRVFDVFQRLHGNEHPGNGLGLAFCRRAIERLGGRMWMESAPGAGSTFYFTVPDAE